MTGGAWPQDRAGLGLRADNAHIICRMVITVDLKKPRHAGPPAAGSRLAPPEEDLGILGRSRWRILPRGMTGRRWGFRRRNNRIFINVDIDLQPQCSMQSALGLISAQQPDFTEQPADEGVAARALEREHILEDRSKLFT